MTKINTKFNQNLFFLPSKESKICKFCSSESIFQLLISLSLLNKKNLKLGLLCKKVRIFWLSQNFYQVAYFQGAEYVTFWPSAKVINLWPRNLDFVPKRYLGSWTSIWFWKIQKIFSRLNLRACLADLYKPTAAILDFSKKKS